MKKSRYFIIFLFILLMVAMILILNFSWLAEQEEPVQKTETLKDQAFIPTEQGVFRRSEHSTDYAEMPDDPEHQRTLREYYANRAYNGAPPVIPHPLISEKGIGGKDCLQCHENGGFVKKFEAYAPVTPHPELVNCRQCHVPVKTKLKFAESEFRRAEEPETGQSALQGSPPMIPHSLTMRSNCLSCHAGPAAPEEIRVTHPTRVNCRQCHVPVKDLSSLEWQPNRPEDIEKIKKIINDQDKQ